MKPNHHNHASPCATSRARHTSSTRFLTKLLAASTVSLFALMLATPDVKAEPETNAEAGAEVKKAQDLITLLTPRVTLCASLQKLGSSVEPRGKYQEILDALKTSDYERVNNAIYKANPMMAASMKPGYEGFKDSYEEFLLEMNFPLFLKTTFKSSRDGKTLYFIEFVTTRIARYLRGVEMPPAWPSLKVDARWEDHPDGIGYVHYWTPRNSSLIVAATQKEYEEFLKTIGDYEKEQKERIKKDQQRVYLGDLTREEAQQKYEQIREETKTALWAKALEWAATETKPETNAETKTEARDEVRPATRPRRGGSQSK